MNQPNIVLCCADQLRAFEVGCYGNPVIRTPHLDRLAAGGVRFQTAVTNFPVCMAARSVLLSGQHNRTCTGGIGNVSYLTRPGDFNMPEYPDAGRPHLKDPSLPELLRARGYHTRAITVRTPTHLYALDGKGERKGHYDCVGDPCQMHNLTEPAPALEALIREWDAATPWMR